MRRLGVTIEDGHAHAGGGDRKSRQAEDLPALVHQLHLLVGVPVAAVLPDLRQQVEGDAMGKLLVRRRPQVEERARLLLQLVDSLLPGAGDRLVGGDDHSLQPRRFVQGLQHHHQLDGAAVGIRDDPAPTRLQGQVYVPRVHLGNHQRAVGLHAERAGVVDHHRSRPRGVGSEFARNRGARREERNVHPGERVRLETLDGHLAAHELQLVPFAPLGRERDQLAHGKLALLEHFHHLAADHPGRSRDGHLVLPHFIRLAPNPCT